MPVVNILAGMQNGVGVDLSGVLYGDSVIVTPAVANDGTTGGQTSEGEITLVTSQEEQDSALNLSIEVSANFAFAGGSDKFDLSQKLHYQQFCVTLVVRNTVLNALQQMRDVVLRPDAIAQLAAGRQSQFRQQFGDYFVQGVQTGGEYCAVLQIIGTDSTDQQNITETIQASGMLGPIGASTNDSFSSGISKATSKRTTKFDWYQSGGKQGQSLDPNQLVQKALDFAETVNAGQSWPVNAMISPYTNLDLPPGPDWVDLEAAKESIANLVKRRTSMMTDMNGWLFVQQNPNQFTLPPGLNLNNIIDRFGTAIDLVTSAASHVVTHPADAANAFASLTSLDVPQDAFPPRISGIAPPIPGPVSPIAPVTVDPMSFLHGAIAAKYVQMGGLKGSLGMPLTHETPAANGGYYNDFSNGFSVYWTQATGAHFVHGAIKGKWLSLGGPTSPWGYPTSDEMPNGPVITQTFSHATITWTQAAGVSVVMH